MSQNLFRKSENTQQINSNTTHHDDFILNLS